MNFIKVQSLSTDELLERLVNGLLYAFCAGFLSGTVMTLMTFVKKASDLSKTVGLPVAAVLLLIALFTLNRYFKNKIVPEIKKRCRE
jgi:hypothetical protein